MRQAIPFGKYLLLDRISVGGMAEVFKAKSYGVEGFEKVIAIKRILPSMGEDRDFIKMFIDEAKIAGQLAHANICQIFELGRIDGSHFIAMEYIWGKDLLQIQNRLRKLRQPMPVAMSCFVVAKVCEGLDYAHRKRDPLGRPLDIVHRDCSPQNVLISYEGEVKLIDFGIAKAASRSSRTMAGVLKGKFGYMSPEQVRGLPLDRRSDLFALGTILYECLTGEKLFQGETDFSTLEKVRNVDIQAPSKLNPQIPEEIERVIMKALAGDPDDRYQWCSELHADLQRYLMTQTQVYTAKSLATWLKDAFANEIDRERTQLEDYKRVGKDGLTLGVPHAEAKLNIVEHLGEAGKAEDPTVLGAPSFDDVVDEGAGPALGSPAATGHPPAGAGRESSRDFSEEAPTAIFGELDNAAQAMLEQARAQVAAQQAAPAVVVGRQTSPVPVVPPPARAPTNAPPMGGRAPTHPPYAPSPSNGGHGAPTPPAFPAPMPSPSSAMAAAPAPQPTPHGSKTLLGIPAPVITQSGAPLSPYPQPGSSPFPAVGSQPGYGYQQAAAQGFGNIMAPVPSGQSMTPGVAAAAAAGGPVFTPPGYGVNGMPMPLQPGIPSPPGMPAYRDPYDSGPFNALAVGQTVDVTAIRKRPGVGKDVAIGVGIAAVVLGVFAIVKFAVFGGGGSPAAAASQGALVVSVMDNQPAEVWVDGQKKGVVEKGTFKLEKIAVGSYAVKVVRPGAKDCEQKVDVTESGLGMVRCEFVAAAPAPAPVPVPAPVPATAPAIAVGSGSGSGSASGSATPAVGSGSASGSGSGASSGSGSGASSGSGSGSGASSGSGSGSASSITAGSAHTAVVSAPVPPAVKPDATKPAPKIDTAKIDTAKPAPKIDTATTVATKPATTKPDDHHHHDTPKPDTTPATTAPKTVVATAPAPAATDEGFLVAYTTPFARVVVDGTDTGKATPVGPRAKIHLKPGKHKVKFVVGDQSEQFTISIEPGKTTTLTKDLQIGQ